MAEQFDKVCAECKGSGDVQAMTHGRGPDDYEVTITCPACKGTGAVDSECTGDSESAWLVERPGPEWLAIIELGQPMWTKDANKAIRFGSQEDALRVFASPPGRRRMPGYEQATATEHQWPVASATACVDVIGCGQGQPCLQVREAIDNAVRVLAGFYGTGPHSLDHKIYREQLEKVAMLAASGPRIPPEEERKNDGT